MPLLEIMSLSDKEDEEKMEIEHLKSQARRGCASDLINAINENEPGRVVSALEDLLELIEDKENH